MTGLTSGRALDIFSYCQSLELPPGRSHYETPSPLVALGRDRRCNFHIYFARNIRRRGIVGG